VDEVLECVIVIGSLWLSTSNVINSKSSDSRFSGPDKKCYRLNKYKTFLRNTERRRILEPTSPSLNVHTSNASIPSYKVRRTNDCEFIRTELSLSGDNTQSRNTQ